ncbi:hypothetical protein Clacol_002995 [Clathrus columnatus]|uniref:DUF3669 domain-containing protein n=1 Tax=Clathrus columnatus TaxID=1419009 RepID=A0AAV5A289_9AGAM|nr:hypothetical protein Clacol_002995 [Clathrus columnatus]
MLQQSLHEHLSNGSDEAQNENKLRKLGSGTFGTVYFTTATPQVYKKCHRIENSPILAEEYRHLKAIHKALSESGNLIQSPTPLDFHDSNDDEFWDEVKLMFPSSGSTRTGVLSMSRVYPMPSALRARLIDLFCPEDLQDRKASILRRGHHVARLLLGRAEPDNARAAPQRFFRTYNFPLTRMRAEKLGIDTIELSKEMGRMLAQMHMTARNDARDIEIVLGANITSTRTYNKYREPRAWVIDFNQVKDFNFTEEQISLLVDAFFANEAYFPRARTADDLYNVFADAYIDECQKIGEDARKLGKQFIVALEAEQARRDKDK